MARIHCDRVTKRFGDAVVVDRLELEIRDREFMVFLGPSGCGKTTTLNMIAGLEELSEGDIWFNDSVVTHTPPHRREIAMVFQSYALYPQKTVYENIAFPLRLLGTARSEIDTRVRAAANELEVSHLLERRPAELSGGQRQRVALGRAIVRRPTAFLMDEPLSNLDAGLRVSMRLLIKKLHRTMETTFVYVTHDQAEAMTLADRITVMRHGVVQQVDSPDGIYNRPRNRFVAGFLGSPQMNFIDGELDADKAFVRNGLRIGLGDRAATTGGARRVALGLRPEDVEMANGRAPDIEAQVALVSPLGSEQHVNVVADSVELVVVLGKDVRVNIGDRIGLCVDPRRLHVFDSTSESNLDANAG